MNEPALTEAVKAALRSPKQNRRKRLALRFAVVVVAVSVLGAAYWFTRPPELVWWRSPAISKTGLRVQVLIPQDWKLDSPGATIKSGDMVVFYKFFEADHAPRMLRWLLPKPTFEHASLDVTVGQLHWAPNATYAPVPPNIRRVDRGITHSADRYVRTPNKQLEVGVTYSRTNLPAFNRTYRQICNSLTIE